MPQDSIGFFYPTRSVGGAQYLFARMAEYLIEHTPYEVVLIDYEDGFIRKKLADKDCDFIEYRDGEVITIQRSMLLVLSLSFLSLIGKYFILPPTTRLFFWDLHPYNLVEQTALSGFYKRLSSTNAHRMCALVEYSRCKKLARFVEQSAAAHGLAFMAERNRLYNQQLLGFLGQVGYLPIPIETITLPTSRDFASRKNVDSTIHVGWLSRLDSWKTAVLFRFFDDIKAYETIHGPGSIYLHVIGDGPERESVRVRCAGSNVIMAGRLEGGALTEYMLANLHIGFAMGTSALEFAVRGIPTVLTPARISPKNLRQERIYRWLFDSRGYDVAAEETSRPESTYDFSEIIQSIQISGVELLGHRCNRYASENHHIDNVGALFVAYLLDCTLTYRDIQLLGLYEYSLAESFLFALKGFFKKLSHAGI